MRGASRAVQAARRIKTSPRSAAAAGRGLRKGHREAVQRSSSQNSTDLSAFKLKANAFGIFGKASQNVLGKGFISRVRLVKHKASRDYYVAKQMAKEDIIRKNAIGQIEAERRILARFTADQACPFIVQFFGSYQTQESVFFVYEFLSGGELFRQLKVQRAFTNNQCKFYAAEVFCALEFLHACNILHRDLKPENVMIDVSGHIKLIDFGFAKPLAKSGRCYTKLGTANYLAPELLVGRERLAREGYGPAAEWWAFGCLVFELLSGKTAFGSSSMERTEIYGRIRKGNRNQLPRHVHDDAKALVDKLLTASPKQRPRSAAEVQSCAWFAGLDWEAFHQRKIMPPHIPDVRHPGDTSNFDMFGDDELGTDKKANRLAAGTGRGALFEGAISSKGSPEARRGSSSALFHSF